VSSREGDNSNDYNFGFDSWYSRGFRTNFIDTSSSWYSNMSVYTIASISANTLSAISLLPFSFAGKQWDSSSDTSGSSSSLKIAGLIISFTMVKKLTAQHTVLVTTSHDNCQNGCPLVDGGFTDNGPITPILSVASRMDEKSRPFHISLLGPSNTMESIKYLLGQGPLGVWTGAGLNLCPFTQVTICTMIGSIRELVIPMLPYQQGEEYNSIATHYAVFRPEQQIMTAFCSDPLSFDHFRGQCQSDSFCHMAVTAVPAQGTDILFTVSNYHSMLSMVWLRPTQLAKRFVQQYVPPSVFGIAYYANMENWFPDFVAVAPQKGGVGFTKIAGHSLLDYLTYLVERLFSSEVHTRTRANSLWHGGTPTCGYSVFRGVRSLNSEKYNN